MFYFSSPRTERNLCPEALVARYTFNRTPKTESPFERRKIVRISRREIDGEAVCRVDRSTICSIDKPHRLDPLRLHSRLTDALIPRLFMRTSETRRFGAGRFFSERRWLRRRSLKMGETATRITLGEAVLTYEGDRIISASPLSKNRLTTALNKM